MNKTIWGKNVSTKFLEGTALLHAVLANDKFVVMNRIFKNIFWVTVRKSVNSKQVVWETMIFFTTRSWFVWQFLTVLSRWIFYATSNHITGFLASKDWQPDYYLWISATKMAFKWWNRHFPAQLFSPFFLSWPTPSFLVLSQCLSFVPHALILTEWQFVLFPYYCQIICAFSETNEVVWTFLVSKSDSEYLILTNLGLCLQEF